MRLVFHILCEDFVDFIESDGTLITQKVTSISDLRLGVSKNIQWNVCNVILIVRI